MSVKLNFSISAPKNTDDMVYDRFFNFTKKVSDDFRILFEVSKPNLTEFVDIKLDWLDATDSDVPGLYANFVIFGLGLHLTVYRVNKITE